MAGSEVEVAARTPILLLTGFLGSGKTTLLNRLLRTPTGARLGVVVNEFGQVGIDGALLGPGDIVEMSDGCVCCAQGTELWEAALSLVDRAGATQLVVETSGIAEPAALQQQFDELPDSLHRRLDLLGTLCVVDVLHVRDSVARREEARRQILQAGRILLSKLDLCDAAGLEAAHRLLDELGAVTDRAGLLPGASAAELQQTLRWALLPGAARAPGAERATGNGRASGTERASGNGRPRHSRQLGAVSLRQAAPLLGGPLQRLLLELPGEVLRAKGFVRLAGGELAVVQLAGRRVELRPCTPEEAQRAPAESVLVFIGEGLDEDWLRMRLSACSVAQAA